MSWVCFAGVACLFVVKALSNPVLITSPYIFHSPKAVIRRKVKRWTYCTYVEPMYCTWWPSEFPTEQSISKQLTKCHSTFLKWKRSACTCDITRNLKPSAYMPPSPVLPHHFSSPLPNCMCALCWALKKDSFYASCSKQTLTLLHLLSALGGRLYRLLEVSESTPLTALWLLHCHVGLILEEVHSREWQPVGEDHCFRQLLPVRV